MVFGPKRLRLVGGFNPSEKYKSKWESSRSRGENKKYLKPPPRWLFNGSPGWMCQKSPLDHQPKPTKTGSASHCDETWLQSKSAGTSDFLRVFFSVVVVVGGTWLHWLFPLMTKFSQKASRFFLSKLGPGVSLFGCCTNAPRIEMMLLRDVFVCPLDHATNKQRTSPIQLRLTFPNCFLSFFSETFPPRY